MKKASEVTYLFDESDLKGLIKSHLINVENEIGEVEFQVEIGLQSVGHGMGEREETVFRGIKATVKNND